MSEPRRVSEIDLNALAVQVEGLDLEENRLGSGAYGVVFKVTVKGKECIAKKLHNVDPSVDTKLTVNPGNLYYMPPEGRVENPHYTTKLDIFSFGNLIIHTIIGEVPRVYDVPPSDPSFGKYVQDGKLELMRRNTAVHKKMGETHCLYPLVVHCLKDSPEQRPSVGEVRISLRKLCVRQYPGMVSGEYHCRQFTIESGVYFMNPQ